MANGIGMNSMKQNKTYFHRTLCPVMAYAIKSLNYHSIKMLDYVTSDPET